MFTCLRAVEFLRGERSPIFVELSSRYSSLGQLASGDMSFTAVIAIMSTSRSGMLAAKSTLYISSLWPTSTYFALVQYFSTPESYIMPPTVGLEARIRSASVRTL